ncbi:unnamed protein product [Boreogadus saida]
MHHREADHLLMHTGCGTANPRGNGLTKCSSDFEPLRRCKQSQIHEHSPRQASPPRRPMSIPAQQQEDQEPPSWSVRMGPAEPQ